MARYVMSEGVCVCGVGDGVGEGNKLFWVYWGQRGCCLL